MRKKLMLLLAFTVLSSLIVGSVQATPVNDLTKLADYFPEDSLAFAALRTDDAYFTEIDGLMNLLNNNFGGDVLPPGIGSRDLLDMLLIEETGMSLEMLAGWLGDSLAIGIPPQDLAALADGADPSVIIAAEVSDRAAAEDLIRLAAGSDVVESAEDGYTLFSASDASVAISDSVFLLTVNYDVTLALRQESSLADSETFQAALAALPLSDYNIAAYVDVEGFNQVIMEVVTMAAQETDDAEALLSLMGPSMQQPNQIRAIAAGFTLTDGRNLIADLAMLPGEGGMSSMLEISGMSIREPANLEFASRIPADAELVILDSQLGPQILGAFVALDQITPMLQAQLDVLLNSESAPDMLEDLLYEAGIYSADSEMILSFLQQLDFSTVKLGGLVEIQLTRLFAGLTGLNLRTDVLEVLDGDFAAWASLYPLESDLSFTLDLGVVSGAEAAASSNIVEGIAAALDLYGISYSSEDIGDGKSLVFETLLPGLLSAAGLPAELLDLPELDIVIGSNADVFAIGSRPGAEQALARSGEALGGTANFQYVAANLIVPEAQSILLINVQPLIDALPALNPLVPGYQLQEVAVVGAVLENAVISSRTSDEAAVVRLALSIPAEPYVIDPVADDSGAAALPTMAAMPVSRYDGLPQAVSTTDFAVLGMESAPVKVALYASFSCPHCANFDLEYMDTLVDQVRAGEIELSYVPMLTGNVPGGDIATAAAFCAGEQGRFWQMHDVLFDLHREIGTDAFVPERLERGLVSIGVDMSTFEACMQSERGFSFLNNGIANARENGVAGTPTVFVNGEMVQVADMLASIAAAQK